LPRIEGKRLRGLPIIENFLPGVINLSNYPKLKSLRYTFAAITGEPVSANRISHNTTFWSPIQWTNFIGNDLYLLLLRCPCCSRRTQAFDGDYHSFLKYGGCPAPTEDRKEGCLSFFDESFHFWGVQPRSWKQGGRGGDYKGWNGKASRTNYSTTGG